MIKRVLVMLSAVVILVSGAMFTVSAQDGPTPEQAAAAAADTRQALFKLFVFNLGPIAAMAQGAPFDAEVAERNARRIAAMAPMIPEVLAADTRGFDLETEALDLIWDNQDDIAAKTQALIDNATAFADAAATGDMGATLGAFRAFGGSCGNCHDTYREDND